MTLMKYECGWVVNGSTNVVNGIEIFEGLKGLISCCISL